MRRSIVIAAALCAIAVGVSAQDTADKPAVVHNTNPKFAPIPGAPDCLTAAPQHGDPATGPSVLLLKFDSTCVIPWHWHSVNETLFPVVGLLQVTGKGEKLQVVSGGDYAYMPAKHVHQAKCAGTKPCTVFLQSDGPFDLHYVDKDGTEIPPEKALAEVNKPVDKPGAKPAAKPATKP
jgi:quercetin dioxygenase-like cupin family protein